MHAFTRNIFAAVMIGATSSALGAGLEPRLEWSHELKSGRLDASLLAYPPAQPDGIVIGSGGMLWRIDGRGDLRFTHEIGPPSGRRMFNVGIVPGRESHLLVGHNDGVVGLVDAGGNALWTCDIGREIRTFRQPLPVDLDGDERCEILVPSRDDWLTCLSPDGELLWRSEIARFRHSTPAVGDINNDGRPEIVVGTANCRVLALDSFGRLVWQRHHEPFHLGRNRPIIADLDDDGRAEIYMQSSNIVTGAGLVCLNGADGSIRWTGDVVHKAYHGLSLVTFADGQRGVLSADKANMVAAFNHDGTLRWRTELSGHGIWAPPVVADLDGDGGHEVVVTVRQTSRDGQGVSWYILDLDGNLLGRHAIPGGGYGGALVDDIDGDGVLELVIVSRSGHVHCYTFGGPARPGAVQTSSWTAPPYALRQGGLRSDPDPPAVVILGSVPPLHYGVNRLEDIAAVDAGETLEVMTTASDGSRRVRCYARLADGVPAVTCTVNAAGPQRVQLRWLDSAGRPVGQQSLEVVVNDPVAPLATQHDETVARIDALREALPVGNEAAVGLLVLRAQIDVSFDGLRHRIDAAGGLVPRDADRLADDVAAFQALLRRASARLRLTEAEVEDRGEARFILWPDANPWDDIDPLDELPTRGGVASVTTWLFGGETESVCVNAVNLTARSLTLRVEPGTVERSTGNWRERASLITTLHRPVRQPSRFGGVVPDLLPKLGEGHLLHIGPGEAEQLWINVNAATLEPGSYVIRWPVRTLDAHATTVPLRVEFSVSSVALPKENRFSANFWSKNRIGDVDTTADLSAHGQNVWTRIVLPAARADVEGRIIEPPDFTAHDAVLAGAGHIRRILYGGIPMPNLPEGVAVTPELELAAQRSYVQVLIDHLATLGLGYDDFMLYPEDEPGLTGSIDGYMHNAEANKAIDPRLNNYANPWGSITVEKTQRMAPVTDVWQPGMATIDTLGQPYLDAMRAGGKPIWMFSVVGSVRIMRPLGFYRAQAWVAFHWGGEGGAGGRTTGRISGPRIPLVSPNSAAWRRTGVTWSQRGDGRRCAMG